MMPMQHVPRFSPQEAAGVCHKLYGLRGAARPLPAERDQNFLITTEGSGPWILKIANAGENRLLLEAQNEALRRLATRVDFCPRIQPTAAGEVMAAIDGSAGAAHFVRLLSYLPGTPLGDVKAVADDLLQDLGGCLGRLDAALSDFDHPGAHRRFQWDTAHALDEIRAHLALVEDPALRATIAACADDFARHDLARLAGLRQSVIHNDANDYNVLVDGDAFAARRRVTGIIDFGDLIYSPTVCDPAVAMAYALLGKSDPLASAAQVLKGYQAAHPLGEDEIAVLFGLVRLRLCLSACLAAFQQRQSPDNEYLSISQGPIRQALPVLAGIHRSFGEAFFRETCGLPPFPRTARFRDWAQARQGRFASIVDADLRTAPVAVFDLSVASDLIDGDPAAVAEPDLSRRLFETIRAQGASVGIGRYNEARLIYGGALFTAGDAARQRTVHFGMDVFMPAGSPVYAPLAGTVHAVGCNAAPLDYGPVVILRHAGDRDEPFYTLYGHMSRESLEHLRPGQAVEGGALIGAMGVPAVNGGYPPHVHFQIILDLLDLGLDFPGVARAAHSAAWCAFSPDPNLILGIPEDRFPPAPPTKSQTLARRRKYIGRNLSIGYHDPVKIVRGWKQYLFDETGRRYLDAYNNVPHVGHCHPRVVAAACRQMRVLNTNTRYLHDALDRYAERLTQTLPEPLRVCFFVNSASEGNELALRLARAYTGRRDMIVLEAAYHGHTTSLIDISPYKHAGPGGGGAPAWVHTAPLPDVYRGPFKAGDPDAGKRYAQAVGKLLDDLAAAGGGPAGFIAESCPSVGGQIFLPPGYLQAVYQMVRAAGGLCIADEVQTGYGRIGTHFYAFETQQVVPDIVVLGKPIGNGHPISAVITTASIAEAFDNGMEFFSTFGGNTVSCAVGPVVLDVLRDEDLQRNALRAGARLSAGMADFPRRHALVGDVRGSGLFLGVELVRSRDTLEPADREAAWVVNRMRERGILMGTDGPYHNVLKIRPPMPFDASDADCLVENLDAVLAETGM